MFFLPLSFFLCHSDRSRPLREANGTAEWRNLLFPPKPTKMAKSRITLMPDDPDRDRKPDPMVQVARYSELGFIIPAAVLVGFGFGKLLDYWLHTTWIYIPGLLLGAVAGFTDVIRRAWPSSKDE